MSVLSRVITGPRTGLKKGFSLRLIVAFTVLTLVLTAIVILAWEQVLRPPYYRWVARNFPGSENVAVRWKFEQRGEHFFISMTVDIIVVSILLAMVDRQQRRLVEAHEKLAHSEKIATLGRVAAQVAHEVRNPLAGLLLYSEHLKGKISGKVSDGEVELVDKIIHTVNNLTSTTEQILNYARPVKLAPQRVDLNSVARDVIQLLSTEISTNRIETRLDLSSAPVTGMLDEASIRSAALNLVLNAVQSMPTGGHLRISTGSKGDKLWMVIADTGSGMSPDQIKHIFEPFSTTKSRGLGLGMPYAQKIIEQHGGTILVQSKLHKGTEVRIELPVRIESPSITGVHRENPTSEEDIGRRR
jgi:signal transduction histidine kinase